jgi:rare lipoprotein A
VRINDRGPFVGDRIIDLSYTAAAKLDFLAQGTAPVEVRVITPGRGSRWARPPAAAAAPTRGPITAPPPAPAVPPPPPPVAVVNAPAAAPGAQAMFIQAGVFADHENARRRVEVLLAAGLELASLEEMQRERRLHRVRVGPFASVEEFDRAIKRLRELGIDDAILMTP